MKIHLNPGKKKKKNYEIQPRKKIFSSEVHAYDYEIDGESWKVEKK